MIPLLAAAALLLILSASSDKKTPEPTPAKWDPQSPPTEMSKTLMTAAIGELATLGRDPAQSARYAKISELLNSTAANPIELYGYAIGLMPDPSTGQKQYPALATALVVRFNTVTNKVTGKSGRDWLTWSPGVRADGLTPVDVLYGALQVISYVQKGSDKSTRKLTQVYLDPSRYSDPAEMQKILEDAKSDFV